MSVGTCSIQTSKVKETIALLAIYTNLDIKKKKKNLMRIVKIPTRCQNYLVIDVILILLIDTIDYRPFIIKFGLTN